MVYLSPRKIPGFPAMADWDVSLTWPSLLASQPTQLLRGGGKHCNAWHLTHHLTVRYPRCARIVSRQVGRRTLTTIKWACIPTPYSFQFYFCFYLFHFLYCWSSARSNSWISCFCSCTTAAYTYKRSCLGTGKATWSAAAHHEVWCETTPLSCSFTVIISWHPLLVNTVQGGVTGEWQAQLELLLKLESTWRPGTFQRVKYCCCPLMKDRTAKPKKSRDCHWKYVYWRTVIGSLWQIKMRQNRLVVFYKAAYSDPFKCRLSEICL